MGITSIETGEISVEQAAQSPRAFESFGGRCAVEPYWHSGHSRNGALILERLAEYGIRSEYVDAVEELRRVYSTESRRLDGPRLIQAAFGRKGVRIPGRLWEQLDSGRAVTRNEVLRGDLVVAMHEHECETIGLATGDGTFVGVDPEGREFVEEERLDVPWARERKLLVRRLVDLPEELVTLIVPTEVEINDSSDMYRVIEHLFAVDRRS